MADREAGDRTKVGPLSREETLDPTDWATFRTLAHRMLDDALDYQRTLRDAPAWRPMPDEAKAAIGGASPAEGRGDAAVYDDFRTHVLPYAYGNVHPRHWGWVNGQGTPLTVMADMLAATMNPNCWGGEHAASYVEAAVLDWLKGPLGMPREATGVLTSGGSVANLIGLAAAREARAGGDVAGRGLRALDADPLIYASSETHNSVDKAVALLGLGTAALVHVPADDAFRIDVAALRTRIAEDRAAGRRPMAVVANAGTVNTGAIDDIGALADVCADEGLWLHVDGAFGAMLALSDVHRARLAGIERADSIAFDLHKWMYLPIECGCVLVRDTAAHRRTFSTQAGYLALFERGIPSGEHFFTQLGPQLTRGFRALKVWFAMRAYGTAKLGRMVEQNVRQAAALERLVRAHPRLELIAPAPLNVVCFRFVPAAGAAALDLDALNRELLTRLWESGAAAPSYATVRGRFAIRCAFTNHRTRLEDLDVLLAAVDRIGREMVQGYA